MKNTKEKSIIFIDGNCTVCNRFSTWLLKKDKKKILFFAFLQGETAKKLLPESYTKNVNSLVYKTEKKLLSKFEALREILKSLSFPYNCFAYLLRIIPLFIANKFYDFFAKNRSFGGKKKEVCRFNNKQFLD